MAGHAIGGYLPIFKDVQGPQLPTGAWPGGPYKGRETAFEHLLLTSKDTPEYLFVFAP